MEGNNMKVYVCFEEMYEGNDDPRRVFTNEADAKAYVIAHQYYRYVTLEVE
jgi:hypothetical protein